MCLPYEVEYGMDLLGLAKYCMYSSIVYQDNGRT